MTQTIKMAVEHLFITYIEDQDEALDAAVEFGKSQNWILVSVIWKDKNESGHHRFVITHVAEKKINEILEESSDEEETEKESVSSTE